MNPLEGFVLKYVRVCPCDWRPGSLAGTGQKVRSPCVITAAKTTHIGSQLMGFSSGNNSRAELRHPSDSHFFLDLS